MSERPAWWKPGMSEAEIQIWEAAQRTADAAPELRPGDDVHMQIRQLLGGCLAPAREERGAA